MKPIKIYSSWGLSFEMLHHTQIELYVDMLPQSPKPPDTLRVLFLLEPPQILDLTREVLLTANSNLYDYILTHNQHILDNTSNSYLFPFGMCWIPNYEFVEKKFEISTLVGGKVQATGHRLRHALWYAQDNIHTPTKFFLSKNFSDGVTNYKNNPVLESSKSALFDSQFHICIENEKRDNWFTEKLIDCLIAKTIPIYYGCPNIDKWFDTRGFLIVDSLEDIITCCNSLNDSMYSKMSTYIDSNYLRAKEYVSLEDRLRNKLVEFLR